jgi:hypothetical protein
MGGSNDLESSKDCRSAGGHGNQHVRLRGAQIGRIGTICPVRKAIFAFGPRQASRDLPLQLGCLPNLGACARLQLLSRAPVSPPDPQDFRRCDLKWRGVGVARWFKRIEHVSASQLIFERCWDFLSVYDAVVFHSSAAIGS